MSTWKTPSGEATADPRPHWVRPCTMLTGWTLTLTRRLSGFLRDQPSADGSLEQAKNGCTYSMRVTIPWPCISFGSWQAPCLVVRDGAAEHAGSWHLAFACSVSRRHNLLGRPQVNTVQGWHGAMTALVTGNKVTAGLSSPMSSCRKTWCLSPEPGGRIVATSARSPGRAAHMAYARCALWARRVLNTS